MKNSEDLNIPSVTVHNTFKRLKTDMTMLWNSLYKLRNHFVRRMFAFLSTQGLFEMD